MEETHKKSRGVVSSKFFPTDEELAELAETRQYDLLDKALLKRTAYNAIRQVKERRGGNLMEQKDVIKAVLLYMDIRDVLNLSFTTPVVSSAILDNDFWKQKISIDMPELLYPPLWARLDEGNKLTSYVDKNKARNVYMVFRYLINVVKRELVRINGITLLSRFKVVHTFEKGDIFCQTFLDAGDKQIGGKVMITFREFFDFCKRFSSMYKREIWIGDEYNEYLYKFLSYKFDKLPPKSQWGSCWNPDEDNWLEVFKLQFQYPKDGITNRRNIIDFISRGYVKKDAQGRIFIGSEMCDHCQEKPMLLKLGCCEQVAYCSEECAKQGWAAHKEECMF